MGDLDVDPAWQSGVVDTLTERLILHPFTVEEAERVLAGTPGEEDRWEGGYPFADELDVVRMFLSIVEEQGDPAPFGPYIVRRIDDGAAIGGIGFFGAPDADGLVEFGFGLVPGVRGHGFATEAVRGALTIAAQNGARAARADTTPDNEPAQHVLRKAGMSEISRDAETVLFEITLPAA
ncbi:Protein N-acetyltransferase, RimJ/RimL family [Microterricola viridarii]|uniref:Protein N-acetyltransferase, RimJ/RimL family n=1 Tax=Microterricola viridarii TaxID=412690 RepID=A0A1H1M5Y3_9MICO|nr:Protein N-acetyltransferase, RimJ/RimL family [Microterricola viridarii]